MYRTKDRDILDCPSCGVTVTRGWEPKVVNTCPNCGAEWKLVKNGHRVMTVKL